MFFAIKARAALGREGSAEVVGVNQYLGFTIIPHSLAIEYRVWHTVERVGPPKKRRKRWRVMRHESRKPGCFQMGNTLYMHPDLMDRLGTQFAAAIT